VKRRARQTPMAGTTSTPEQQGDPSGTCQREWWRRKLGITPDKYRPRRRKRVDAARVFVDAAPFAVWLRTVGRPTTATSPPSRRSSSGRKPAAGSTATRARRSAGPRSASISGRRSRPTLARAIIASRTSCATGSRSGCCSTTRCRGLATGGPVQALRPCPQAADGVPEGRQGQDAADPGGGVLARPGAPHPRRRRRAGPLPDDGVAGRTATARRTMPDKPMSAHGLHKWWYRCLANAGSSLRA
jgi:hypothetical protein